MNVTTCQLCHHEARNLRMSEGMVICDACAVSKLLQETIGVLCDVAQILDGWHNDGTVWSQHDESVRKRVSALQSKLENEMPKKTKCHCGKPLNENGLCYCCDPISTCWPQ